jgi:hypothetical protein
VMAAALAVALGLVGNWPASEARDVPPRQQAEMFALCRDALQARLHVELLPEVLELPVVRVTGAERYRVVGSATLHDTADPFSCDVHYRNGVATVSDVRLLAW